MTVKKPKSSKRGSYKRGIRRQRLILNSAVNLLINEGYHKFSLRKVAKINGISPGNLQHYFSTKEELVEAMLDKVIQRYIKKMQSIREHSDTPQQQFENVILHVIADLSNKTTTIFFPELWSLANQDKTISKLMDDMYNKYRAVIGDIVSEINSDLSQAQINRATLFIAASIEGHTIFIGHLKPERHETKNITKMAISAFLHLVETGDIPLT